MNDLERINRGVRCNACGDLVFEEESIGVFDTALAIEAGDVAQAHIQHKIIEDCASRGTDRHVGCSPSRMSVLHPRGDYNRHDPFVLFGKMRTYGEVEDLSIKALRRLMRWTRRNRR